MVQKGLVENPAMEELGKRLLKGDEAALGDLLALCGPRVESAIRKTHYTLSAGEAEEVVSEGIFRFWAWHKKKGFDPKKSAVMTMLYRFSDQVVVERVTGRLLSQKQMLRERSLGSKHFELPDRTEQVELPPDDTGKGRSPVQTALADCYAKLLPLQQDILLAFALAKAKDFDLDAAQLGVELGRKHKGGVLIPGGSIRTTKSRAWDTLELCVSRRGFNLKAMGYFDE